MKKYERYIPPSTPETAVPMPPVTPDSTDKIVQDIMKTERAIAQETMQVIRSRYERERGQWERIYQDKEQETHLLRKQLNEAEERLKKLEKQCDEERKLQLEQLQQTARDIEARQAAEKKKWTVISDEVKSFRDAEMKAQAKMLAEQEKAARLKKTLVETERALKEHLAAKDEELFQLKEQTVGKEELWLKTKDQTDKEISRLQERLNALQLELNDERQYQSRLVEKKDADLAKLQSALQEVIVQLNDERKRSADFEEKTIQQQQRAQELEDQLKQAAEQNEIEKQEWKKTWQEEQTRWEKYKQEFTERDETRTRETEEQVQRIMKTVALLEQQLAEENKLRQERETLLQKKDGEIQNLTIQKEELVAEWRKILEGEKEALQKRQSEISAEFDRNRQARDEELVNLQKEMCALQAALSEEKKLHLIEKEEKKQLTSKFQYIEQGEQRLIEQLNTREKEWKESLEKEQGLYRKQIDDLTRNMEAQLKARETEISRLSGETKNFNDQAMELRQKLSQEKNESNNRLGRIQDLENQIKALTQRSTQENTEWENKYKSLQAQWESHRNKNDVFESDMENIYQKDIQVYRDKIKKLNAKITELQQKLDLTPGQTSSLSRTNTTASMPAADRKSPAPAERPITPKDKGTASGSIQSRVNSKFYPGK